MKPQTAKLFKLKTTSLMEQVGRMKWSPPTTPTPKASLQLSFGFLRCLRSRSPRCACDVTFVSRQKVTEVFYLIWCSRAGRARRLELLAYLKARHEYISAKFIWDKSAMGIFSWLLDVP